MRILSHVLPAAPAPAATTAPASAVAPVVDVEVFQAFNRRIESLEAQLKKPAPRPDFSEFIAQWAQFKLEFESQWKAAAATMRKTLDALEERVRCMEQSPKPMAESVVKEAESRLRSELAILEKSVSDRFDKLALTAPVIVAPPVPILVEKATEPSTADWDARFVRQENVLAELMKEIAVAAPAPLPAPLPVSHIIEPEPLSIPSKPTPVAESPSSTTFMPPAEFSNPGDAGLPFAGDDALPSFELPHDLTHRPRPRSAVVRLWNYLNAPAFSAEHPAD